MTGDHESADKQEKQEPMNGEAQAADAVFQDASADDAQSTPGASDVQRWRDEARLANDRALRATAELENFRKRMRREAEEERRYAALPVISELLPVIDNLDRAIESSQSDQTAEDLVSGVRMVQSQFLSVLDRHGCRRMGSVGEAFDPNLHQAIAQEPSAELAAGLITRITRYGYQLHDRVVRPAEVLVSSGPPAPSAGGAEK